MKYPAIVRGEARQPFSLITTHGAILALVAQRRQVTGIELARAAGVTERTVQKVLGELEVHGYISRRRVGRFNHFEVHYGLDLRAMDRRDLVIGAFLDLLLGLDDVASSTADRATA